MVSSDDEAVLLPWLLLLLLSVSEKATSSRDSLLTVSGASSCSGSQGRESCSMTCVLKSDSSAHCKACEALGPNSTVLDGKMLMPTRSGEGNCPKKVCSFS
jgi:hypothetical protein